LALWWPSACRVLANQNLKPRVLAVRINRRRLDRKNPIRFAFRVAARAHIHGPPSGCDSRGGRVLADGHDVWLFALEAGCHYLLTAAQGAKVGVCGKLLGPFAGSRNGLSPSVGGLLLSFKPHKLAEGAGAPIVLRHPSASAFS